jgi:phosphatidylserine/phosphatidylglycerophosphate/cardiolipin synthase-like enzyme
MQAKYMNKTSIAVLFTVFATAATAKGPTTEVLGHLRDSFYSATDKAPSSALIETAFSPDGASERLIIKVINASQKSIRLAAYSFTSPPIVRALMDAKKRGVDVQIVVDEKGNKSKSGTAALNLTANAGIPTRTNGHYAIHHDKYIVSDAMHVQTGSFNYSKAAQASNSENVVVIWNNPAVAASYLKHWDSRFNAGKIYESDY